MGETARPEPICDRRATAKWCSCQLARMNLPRFGFAPGQFLLDFPLKFSFGISRALCNPVAQAKGCRSPVHSGKCLGILAISEQNTPGPSAWRELGPFLPVGLDPLRAAAFHRLGFAWSSLCNPVAVQPGCTNLGLGALFHSRPMPTTTAALVREPHSGKG